MCNLDEVSSGLELLVEDVALDLIVIYLIFIILYVWELLTHSLNQDLHLGSLLFPSCLGLGT